MKQGERKTRTGYRLPLFFCFLIVCTLWMGACGLDGAEETKDTGSGAVTAEKDQDNHAAEENGTAGPELKEAGKAGTDGNSAEEPAVLQKKMPEPLQNIIFTGDKENTLQRSMPVQIDAVAAGGEKGTTCWALFLPSEIADHPRIRFSQFESVTMEPLEDSGSGTGTRTYASGDEAEGLVNGSRFRVRMSSADGNVQEEDLRVFSSAGMASMYLDTESGSMEKIDTDVDANTTEEADWLVMRAEGGQDSAGKCRIKGRGNSTWHRAKKPYNVTLTEAQSVLGMQECKKLCLLANAYDDTNLLNRMTSQIAISLGMRDTPQGEFVNLYLNGQYNGLYYLSQRVRTGGSVRIQKLDNKILQANHVSEESDPLPKRVALHEMEDGLKKWAFDWPNEPRNNTGGYLLEQRESYDGDDAWFSTKHRRFRIISPSYPTPGEVNYLQDYMRTAERAIYSEDGRDPDSGRHYSAWLDLPSWQDMFLMEEYFCEWDGERWSFFITKDRDDPYLYCGPIWDFDHSAGQMLHGTYPETAVSLLMFRDTRHGWMHQLLTHEDFTETLYERWENRFSPALRGYLDDRFDEEVAAIESAAYMNNIRRANDFDYREKTEELKTWLYRRADFLDHYVKHKEDYVRVEFQFSWGSLSHYVLPGNALGYLPLPEYGETQVPSQVKKHEIVGWQDEDGNEISADILIDRDRVFTPVYR